LRTAADDDGLYAALAGEVFGEDGAGLTFISSCRLWGESVLTGSADAVSQENDILCCERLGILWLASVAIRYDKVCGLVVRSVV
jgi:hypothetical protein